MKAMITYILFADNPKEFTDPGVPRVTHFNLQEHLKRIQRVQYGKKTCLKLEVKVMKR